MTDFSMPSTASRSRSSPCSSCGADDICLAGDTIAQHRTRAQGQARAHAEAGGDEGLEQGRTLGPDLAAGTVQQSFAQALARGTEREERVDECGVDLVAVFRDYMVIHAGDVEAGVSGILRDAAGELVGDAVLGRERGEMDVPCAGDREVFGAPLLALFLREVDRACRSEAVRSSSGGRAQRLAQGRQDVRGNGSTSSGSRLRLTRCATVQRSLSRI